jgi:hypothetical protein
MGLLRDPHSWFNLIRSPFLAKIKFTRFTLVYTGSHPFAPRCLFLPPLKFQFQYFQFQILSLATRRRYAMNIQRHCHSTSEQIGCPLKGGVARARHNCRQRSTLLPRVLRNRLQSPDPQLPLPASIRSFEATSSSKEEFSWRKGTFMTPRPNCWLEVSKQSTLKHRLHLDPT